MPSSAVDISHTINLSDAGLVLGGETRLARFADKTDRLAFDTERLTALLSVAFGQPPSYRNLAAIAAAATDWQLGDKALANLRLVFSGLPRLDAPEDIYRLKAAEILFDAGLTAADLAETLGFDPQDDDFGKGYNSAQPRVPAGSGPTSGQWTKLWARFSAWLNEDVPEYDRDTGTQVGTRSRARAIATNPLTWIAGGAAVLAGGEIVAATPAVGSLAVDAPAVLPAIEEAQATNIAANAARGAAAEARVLADMGLARNTSFVTTFEGASVPDALTEALSVEIKDAARISATKQVRIQTQAAKIAGRESWLVTGQKTVISKKATEAFTEIIRRPDLGPR